MYGRNVHARLVSKATKYFSERGYTVIKEAKMSGKTRIDVLALKGSEKIGIECQLTISYDIIKQKFRDYGKNLSKMIFVVPSYREMKTKIVLDKISEEEGVSRKFFDLWTENIDIQTSMRISKKTKDLIDSIGKFGETYDDVIRYTAEYYKKHVKVKK
jgi:hypothetical protein